MSVMNWSGKVKVRSYSQEIFNQDSDLHPLLKRIFAAREVESLQHCEYAIDKLLPPDEISNLSEAAKLLCQHIQKGNHILIFGDYDADGATSTALCIRSLTAMGHQNCTFRLPDRFVDGYGLSTGIAQKIQQDNPDCVITVDTGIASFDGIKLLRKDGIDLVVTDHHLPSFDLPDANVIVNPNAFKESGGKNLAGVGVAFYLMLAIRKQLRTINWFENNQIKDPNLAEMLDLVAIGTVADLVPLDFNNRILVNEGLKRIQAGFCSDGIKQLVQSSNKSLRSLTSTDIGFAIAPKINAAGRLDDMTTGVYCLLAEDQNSANKLAHELHNINDLRKKVQNNMNVEALLLLEEIKTAEFSQQYGIVLFQKHWHQGVVGIIASKIKDKTYRPCIVFAEAEDGSLKGSGRSIAGIHLRDVLDLIDKKKPGLIDKFGGHAMAAGLSLNKDNLVAFTELFDSCIKQSVDSSCFQEIIECDGELEIDNITLDTAQLIRQSGPWGQRFPLPSFVGQFDVINQRILTDKHLKFVLKQRGIRNSIDAIAFFVDEHQLDRDFNSINIHYELDVNEYRGASNLQLIIRDIL